MLLLIFSLLGCLQNVRRDWHINDCISQVFQQNDTRRPSQSLPVVFCAQIRPSSEARLLLRGQEQLVKGFTALPTCLSQSSVVTPLLNMNPINKA